MGALIRRLASISLLVALALPGLAGDQDKPAPAKDGKSVPKGEPAPAPAPSVPLARPAPKSLDEALRRMGAVRVTVSFKDEKFDDAVAYIRRVAGFNVIVAPALQPRASGMAPLTLALRDVTLRQVAELLGRVTYTRLKFDAGILEFTTPQDARGKPVLCIYDIGELTMKLRNFPGPDLNLRSSKAEFEDEKESDVETAYSDPQKIVETIQKMCGEGTWSEEGVSIAADERKLLARTYPEVHREIARLLALLRAAR